MRTRRNHESIAMRVAAVLLLLTLLSGRFVSGQYARYATADSAGDAARVAKFLITETDLEDAIDLAVAMRPEDTITRSVAVQNRSEVAVSYVITIRNTTENLPLSLTIAGTDHTAEMNSEEGYSYSSAIAPNSTASVGFTLSWPVEDADDRNPAYSGMVDELVISVRAEQID